MARIPEGFIEELKNKTDLVRYVKQYTQLKKVGRGVWQGQCPHPKHSDSTPSFTVWEKQKSWACLEIDKVPFGSLTLLFLLSINWFSA